MRIRKGEIILSDEDIDRLVIHKLKQIEEVFENHYEEVANRQYDISSLTFFNSSAGEMPTPNAELDSIEIFIKEYFRDLKSDKRTHVSVIKEIGRIEKSEIPIISNKINPAEWVAKTKTAFKGINKYILDKSECIAEDNITIGKDTTMKVTLDNGVVGNGENTDLKFLNGKVTGSFTNKIAENSRYDIKWNEDGSLNITGTATASDVVVDAGGSANNAKTAEAWDSVTSSTTASAGAKAVASVLGDLSQNATTAAGQKAYVDALTAVAPEVAPMVQKTQTETANQVFGAVSTRLTGGSISTGSEGMSSGDSNPDAAVWVQGIIKQIFEEYASGVHSLKSVWLSAKEKGLMSKEPNYNPRSKNYGKICPISRNKIHDILTNTFYYGAMYVADEEIDEKTKKPVKTFYKLINHVYEPIISKELFDKVQKVLKTRKKERFCKEQKYAGIPFVFRGLITCKCGCAITPEHHKKGNKEYVYLRCSHQKGTCNQKLVNENTILEQLEREISWSI